jgi:hypothetical protein
MPHGVTALASDLQVGVQVLHIGDRFTVEACGSAEAADKAGGTAHPRSCVPRSWLPEA